MSQITIKWKDIGNVQCSKEPHRFNTYYYVGTKKMIEWWYDVHTKSWVIYPAQSGGFQEGDAIYVHGKDEVAGTVLSLANKD